MGVHALVEGACIVKGSPPTAERDFPAIYRAANENSRDGQRRFLTSMRIRLAALIVAAGFGAITIRAGTADLAGLVTASAFGISLVAELYLFRAKPERGWYDGRAAAESTKTLTWRFIVGGRPFGKGALGDQEAEELLLDRFNQIANDLNGIHLVPIEDGEQITATMRQARGLPLEQRRELYREDRINDQCAWYASKARWNQARANWWSVALASLEVAGLTGAVLKAAAVVNVDLLGLVGALVAAGAAWIQTKQYQNLSSAYAVAAQELGGIRARMDWPSNEDEWSHFVDQAEDAISREHTLWRASHS